MPTLAEYRASADAFSEKASELNRQLAFAGIALIWLFKVEVTGQPVSLPRDLILPSLLIGAALAFDLLQAVLGASIWAAYSEMKEREGVDEGKDVDHPTWLPWPIDVLFYVKVTLTLLAYCLLSVVLYQRFTSPPRPSPATANVSAAAPAPTQTPVAP